MAPHTEPARCRPFLFLPITTLLLLLLLAASACAAAAPCDGSQGCNSASMEAAGDASSVRQEQNYTVSGSLVLERTAVANWFNAGPLPGVSDTTSGITGSVPGFATFGNAAGADDLPISDASLEEGGVEFGVEFFDSELASGTLLVDVNAAQGFVSVFRGSVVGPTLFARAGNITLISALFGNFNSIRPLFAEEGRVVTRSAVEELMAKLPQLEPADGHANTPPTAASTQAATVQQDVPTWISATLSGDTVTLVMDGSEWPVAGEDSVLFELEVAPLCPDGSACCDGQGGFLTDSTVCRPASGCQRESRCNGVSPDCPTNNKPDGHHCPWAPPHTPPKRGYRPYSNAAPMAEQPAYEHKWHECDGVCYDGACALAWDGPKCCYIAGHGSGYPRDEEEKEEENYAAEAQAAAGTASTEHWEAGDLYCRNR